MVGTDTDESMKQELEGDNDNRKKYRCNEPNCSKVFSRSEHLNRHRLNHNPKVIYKCTYNNCFKTFVRNDLLKRHLKRHELRSSKITNNDFKNIRKLGNERNYKKKLSSFFFLNNDDQQAEETQIIQDQNDTVTENASNKSLISNIKSKNSTSISLFTSSSSSPSETSSAARIPTTTSTISEVSPGQASPYSNHQRTSRQQHSSNFLNWMLNEDNNDSVNSDLLNSNNFDMFTSTSNNAYNLDALFLNFEYPGFDDFNDLSPNSQLLNMFNDQTLFSPYSNNTNTNTTVINDRNSMAANNKFNISNTSNNSNIQFEDQRLYQIDQVTITKLVELIPSLATVESFNLENVSKFLINYWKCFHPQFPFMHKPSFNTLKAPHILLLSMIMLGTNFSYNSAFSADAESTESTYKVIGDLIAVPLRWLIFLDPEFVAPAKLWVFQSLIMLEYYEKSCSTRKLHERAHLHHGTVIQLLRRSPTLGGNPIKLNHNNDGNRLSNKEIYERWVEVESMKRITFTVFYLDTIDAIHYGHLVSIFAHQIQSQLPCNDELWDNMKLSGSEKIIPLQPVFLTSLKKLLNYNSKKSAIKEDMSEYFSKLTYFNKKILFAGLVAVLFQMQQRDLQLSFGLEDERAKLNNKNNKNWKEIITKALAYWKNDIGAGCSNSLVSNAYRNANSNGLIPEFVDTDSSCKLTSFHTTHVYARIQHYDLFIIAGAPWWMNVKPHHSDRLEILDRFKRFCLKTLDSKICLINCFLLLWEMFLSPHDSVTDANRLYDPVKDVFNRSYSIGVAMLYIWDYNFIAEGPESNYCPEGKDVDLDNLKEREEGFSYLRRIRSNLFRLTKRKIHIFDSNVTGSEYYQTLIEYAFNIDKVANKGNMLGLCKLLYKTLSRAPSEIAGENARLIYHCGKRSAGYNVEICDNMYNNREKTE
ncbi:hypothetical protein PACTADRAFT_51240 [Pachysolen tannophilus NRRL Y-2460]|uniref:C2H2-type domain-containing protein n=1 Tax=Pachysolen tannophilus NRRL Y-2460 TaxID=669874 RepID=A0A1E4TRN3_PACTA|nr:hypothetical protein PACTADRAFT_51240 [Pachysolen tannophilus NRRL Y-2460]